MTTEVTIEEEQAMESIRPWHCYTDFGKTLKRYHTLRELADDLGLHSSVIYDIITHLNGVWGAFIIFKPKGLVG